ncbi:MAG: hypothetical protein DU481_07085 [Nitrosomonas sp.]
MIILFLMVVLFTLIPIASLIVSGHENLSVGIPSGLTLEELGQFGDFFGGHISAFASSISLVIVVFFTFHQAKQQRVFFLEQQKDTSKTMTRQFFLEGINLITQWDIKSPGCDQCMRLLDYYGRLALESKDDELLLLLNTVITAKIRQNLEGKNGSFKVTNYPHASKAIKEIGSLRKQMAQSAKNQKV